MRGKRRGSLARWVVGLCCLIPGICLADDDPVPPPVKSIPAVTVSGGGGSTFGGWGLQGEYYFRGGRVSAFGGVGYWPGHTESETFHIPGGAAAALGGRAYTHGLTHRAFVELSVSELATGGNFSPDGTLLEKTHHYGPGVAVGYHHVSKGGLVFLISAGVGYASASSGHSTHVVSSIGIGQMWRR